MRIQWVALVLTVVNLALLIVILSQPRWRTAPPTQLLRTNTFELVDDSGQVRSSLKVESDGTVVLRLMDENGTIRVKLGADEGGSGLVLADETTEPGVHILARRNATPQQPNTTSITLTGANGQQTTITP